MKKLVIVAIALLASITAAGALDLRPGLSLVSSRMDPDHRTVAMIRDSAGRSFSISYVEEPAPTLIDRISRLKDMFYSFRDVKVDTLQFAVTGSLVNATILPVPFRRQGPGGVRPGRSVLFLLGQPRIRFSRGRGQSLPEDQRSLHE